MTAGFRGLRHASQVVYDVQIVCHFGLILFLFIDKNGEDSGVKIQQDNWPPHRNKEALDIGSCLFCVCVFFFLFASIHQPKVCQAQAIPHNIGSSTKSLSESALAIWSLGSRRVRRNGLDYGAVSAERICLAHFHVTLHNKKVRDGPMTSFVHAQ